ncbi:MAG: HAD-IB family hydrolase [Cytophagaceae bacterium]|nr:HAD-IB family hydrolase [Cytophagaceae bacterium]
MTGNKIAPAAIAAFDFDKTITVKDSFTDFLFYSFGYAKVIVRLFIIVPAILLPLFLRMITRERAKQCVFSFFFKGMSVDSFNHLCNGYSKRISAIVSAEAMNRICWHRKRGDDVVIVSASIINWIRAWAKQNGIEQVIGTEPEVKNGILTGKFATPNCKGEEKVTRFLKIYPDRTLYTLYAYGDSKGDK